MIASLQVSDLLLCHWQINLYIDKSILEKSGKHWQIHNYRPKKFIDNNVAFKHYCNRIREKENDHCFNDFEGKLIGMRVAHPESLKLNILDFSNKTTTFYNQFFDQSLFLRDFFSRESFYWITVLNGHEEEAINLLRKLVIVHGEAEVMIAK